jgi:hypothetical protein
MHVKRDLQRPSGPARKWVQRWESVGKRMAKNDVSTERNRMEPVRGRSLVEAARLDEPERLQSPPGYVSMVLRRNTCWAKILGRWSMGPSPLVPCLLEAVWIP